MAQSKISEASDIHWRRWKSAVNSSGEIKPLISFRWKRKLNYLQKVENTNGHDSEAEKQQKGKNNI